MKDLKGKTAIVTGGGGGIGGATCRRFAEEGAQVAVFDMNLEAAQKVADGIVAAGGKAKAFQCNITDRAQVDAAVAAAEAQLGPIDILVNNAGWDIFKPFTKTVPAEWDGTVIAWGGSGTTITVVEGFRTLRFVASRANLIPGSFTVGEPVVIGGSLTVGPRTGADTLTCTVGNHAGASA